MPLHHLLFPLLLLAAAASAAPARFTRHHPSSSHADAAGPTQYYQLTRPLPTDGLTPACSAALLAHSFANTYGLPPTTAAYSPPDECPSPWDAVVLEFSAACRGEQYDRIAGVWLDGVELLRTSTAEPTEDGVFWVVRKDVTLYSTLLRRRNATLSVMLENIVNDVYTGVYHVNISMLYYVGKNNASASVDFESDPTIRVFDGAVMNGGELGLLEERKELNGIKEKLGSSWKEMFGWFGKLGRSIWAGAEDEDGGRREELVSLMKENAEKARELGVLANGGDGVMESLSVIGGGVGELGFGCQDGGQKKIGKVSFSKKPADLIIPVSSNGSDGFWFRIENSSDVHFKSVEVPPNTYKAVLEIYVSFHSDDEFWYSNPPDSYIQQNNLTTGRGNGSFRRVFATIDGMYIGSVVPFPVVFTGGINPLFWEPIVGIGAFDLPSYDLEVTPFLGMLLDGKPHTIGLGVNDGIQYWLVDANLHLWLDHNSSLVQATLVQYVAPELPISRKYKIKGLDGSFKIEAKHKTQFSGWVNSSFGNLTTHIIHELKFKNKIKIQNNGSVMKVEQTVKAETEVRLEAYSVLLFAQLVRNTKYPLELETSTVHQANCTDMLTTTLSNEIKDELSLVLPSGVYSSSLINNQEAEGRMLVQDHSVLSGSSTTKQTYNYTNDRSSYARTVVASGGTLLSDNCTDICLSSGVSYVNNALAQV